VSGPAPVAGPSPTSWRLVNAVLVVLALVLIVATVVFFARARSDEGGGAAARSVSRQYKAVTSAATRESLAFLDVDYKAMDPRIAKVLAGATGAFKTQYSGAASSLRTSATEAQAVSSGKVLSVGVSDLTSKSAVVFVAANSQVTNKSTKGKAQPRYYRLKLALVRSGSSWLTSDLEFVG
jgi:Mce-associated membrane protein